MRRLAVFVLFVALFLPAAARAYELPARAAILLDERTGQVLFEKNADQPLPPASMSKLMTAFMVFERLAEGTLALDDLLPVSENAWRMGGSKMFVEVGDRVRVEDLIKGIVIQSGNDACIVVAEALAGSEAAFASSMTERAQALGLSNSRFKNASGWPAEGHEMSVRDLAQLATLLIERFPQYYDYYSQREFEYNDINQRSRNPLLRAGIDGVDGLKTGYTREAGYGLVASAERDGRRLVMVLAGLETSKARAVEAERLLEYGFRHFKAYELFADNEVVEQAPVWLGAAATVPLLTAEPLVVSLTRDARDGLQVRLAYEAPVPAPITAGTRLGEVTVTAPGMTALSVPLLAGADVPAATMMGRAKSALDHLVWGDS